MPEIMTNPSLGAIRRSDGAIYVLPGRWATQGIVFVRARDVPASRHGWFVPQGQPGPFVRIER